MSSELKVLIAEDEKALAHAMEMKLTGAGYAVDVASDGKQAKDKLKDGTYSIVLLDLIMPVEDGFSVLQYMQDNHVTTPVIVMSNLSQPEDKEKAEQLGAKHFFIKSNSSLSEILDQVQSLIAK